MNRLVSPMCQCSYSYAIFYYLDLIGPILEGNYNSLFVFQKNHLSGLKRKYLKIQFDTVQQLMRVRSDLLHVVEKNEEELNAAEAFESIYGVKRYL